MELFELGEIISDTAAKASEGARIAVETSNDLIQTSQKAIVDTLDQDHDGQFDSTDVILLALKTPGVRIDRESFLRKELMKNHSNEEIDKVIETTPALAGISPEEVDKIADEVIQFERNAVSGISAALGMPGGAAMAATIPADIAQYYGYMLRAAQKLLYLYGFPEILSDSDDVKLDTETVNTLTVCLGVMNGVAAANNFIKGMSKAFATGVEKKLLNTALTKGAVYPAVKNTAKWFGVRMTKEVFAGFFKKTIPVLGGVIGGGLTYATFKPCCDRLKDVLKDTMLSNPHEHQSLAEEEQIFQDIENGVIFDTDQTAEETQVNSSSASMRSTSSTE